MIEHSLDDELNYARNDVMYHVIKEDVIESLHRFVFQKINPGSFLQSVLCNDLVEAVGRADRVNLATLKEIVSYCYTRLPANCWKSYERYEAWLKNERS